MKSSPSGNWLSIRNHRDSPTPSDHSNNLPLTPSFISPRLAPPPPPPSTSNLKPSFKAFNLHTVFRKSNSNRDPSLRSAYSVSTADSSTEIHTIHPFSTMPHAPLPVVSNHDATDDEEECPVCLEPLSFSFRLPGEKPHIVPECGHALHEVRGKLCITLLLYELISSRHALLPSMGHHLIKAGLPSLENPTSAFVVCVDGL